MTKMRLGLAALGVDREGEKGYKLQHNTHMTKESEINGHT